MYDPVLRINLLSLNGKKPIKGAIREDKSGEKNRVRIFHSPAGNLMNKTKILIVDDEVISLEKMRLNLTTLGYDCLALSDSEEALGFAKRFEPDLFLLDLLMPKLSGIELSALIKKQTQFASTPIIFLTADSDVENKIKAFEAGAVDYLTKPVSSKELAARVGTHLELAAVRKKTLEYAAEMERLAEERAKQLIHAERLIALGTLSAGIAHEVNNATTIVSGNAQTLENFWPLISESLEHEIQREPAKAGKLDFILKETPHLLTGMMDGVTRIKKIVDSLRLYSRKEEVRKDKVRVIECVESALSLCEKTLRSSVEIEKKIENPEMEIAANAQQITQVLVNLIVNALDSMQGQSNGRLTIEVYAKDLFAHIVFSDNGPGIPSKILGRIWDPFFTTKEPGKGTGLGLSIGKSIIENHHGTITVSNRPEGGASFHISLPLNSDTMSKILTEG